MKIGQPLYIRLTVPPMTLLKLSGKLLLDGFRTVPCLQSLLVSCILDLKIGESGKCGLKLSSEIVWIPGSLC